jgi:ABC-type polysaccharide/polyol phosphate export permease
MVAKLAAAWIIILFAGSSVNTLHGIALAAVGLIAVHFLLFFLGVLSAYLLDRYRILKAMLPQILFLGFLVTPVVWKKEQLTRSAWLVDYNPLFHGLEVVRSPLLTGTMPWLSMLVVLLTTFLLFAACGFAHSRNRDMIVFRWIS